MCGRYQFSIEQPMLREFWEQAQARFPNVKMEIGEIFPTNVVPVLCGDEGAVTPRPAKWGYPGIEGKGVIINARSETAGEKRMFRDSLRARRCVVPASGFFEWSHDKAKNKYRFTVSDSPILYLAGLYRDFEDGRRFVILTESANAFMADIHDRMPVILSQEQVEPWIANGARTGEILLQPAPVLTREEEGYVQQSLC